MLKNYLCYKVLPVKAEIDKLKESNRHWSAYKNENERLKFLLNEVINSFGDEKGEKKPE